MSDISKEALPTNLAIVINGEKIVEYQRDRALATKHAADLDNLDLKLAKGIELADSQISQPSFQDKSTFVAQLLVNALMHENDAHAAISCAWLATRCPDLKQVQAEQKEDRLTIRLIYDKEYVVASSLKFIPKHQLNS
ncbi:MAG: hypothetical protein P8O97_02420 [Gammaproteobacteria bacterium]|nr:hypothetical protein [Gammaproteobacteria bacterium]